MFFGKKSKAHPEKTSGRPPSKGAEVPSARVNGESTPPPAKATAQQQALTDLAPEELKRHAAVAKHVASTFGETVALLMHSPHYKHHSLADLEWLVMPALLTGQFSITTAQAKKNGSVAPVGVVLWAQVSAEIDKRLNEGVSWPLRLKPQDWKSGEIIWVIAAVGDERVIKDIFKRLQEKEWGNRPAKVLAVAKDGMPTVATLGAKAA